MPYEALYDLAHPCNYPASACALFLIWLSSKQPFPLSSHLPLEQKPDCVHTEGIFFHESGGGVFRGDEPFPPPPCQEGDHGKAMTSVPVIGFVAGV